MFEKLEERFENPHQIYQPIDINIYEYDHLANLFQRISQTTEFR